MTAKSREIATLRAMVESHELTIESLRGALAQAEAAWRAEGVRHLATIEKYAGITEVHRDKNGHAVWVTIG